MVSISIALQKKRNEILKKIPKNYFNYYCLWKKKQIFGRKIKKKNQIHSKTASKWNKSSRKKCSHSLTSKYVISKSLEDWIVFVVSSTVSRVSTIVRRGVSSVAVRTNSEDTASSIFPLFSQLFEYIPKVSFNLRDG